MNIVFISIGISKPAGLVALLGLKSGALRIKNWAQNLGASAKVQIFEINDFDGTKVTSETIKNAIDIDALAAADWVIVYFCGHGFNISDGAVWVIDGTEQEPISFISVKGLQQAIASHGVKNITMIGDACQSLALDKAGANRIIPRGRKVDDMARVDMLYASAKGQAANIVYDGVSRKWEPVFSTVLADVLLNDPPPKFSYYAENLDKVYKVVNNETLAIYIESEVEKRAAAANLEQNAKIERGLLAPNNIYRWIEPEPAAVPRPNILESILGPAGAPPSGGLENLLGCLKGGGTGSLSNLGGLFGGALETLGPSSGASAGDSADNDLNLDELLKVINSDSQKDANLADSAKLNQSPNWTESSKSLFIESTNSEWRNAQWQQFLGVKTSPGELIVLDDGMRAANVSKFPPNLRSAANQILKHSTIQISAASNCWCCLPYYGELAGLISYRMPQNEKEWGVYLAGWKNPDFDYTNDIESEELNLSRYLKGFLTDTLNNENVKMLIAGFRAQKHLNPLVGILACYYYDKIGDFDNIRRTASYYKEHGQAIPIDIALMCRAPIKISRDGKLSIKLPSIGKSAPPFENAPEYLFAARRKMDETPIAGIVPMLRIGWNLLENSRREDFFKKLHHDLSASLTTAPITSFNNIQSREKFTKLIGIDK